MDYKEFKKRWINRIAKELKNFPGGFLNSVETEEMILPGASLMPGAELFGHFEILDGNSNLFMQTGSKARMKYILYANRNKPRKINIPVSEKEMEEAVKRYEKHLYGFLREMKKDYEIQFRSVKNFNEVATSVFNSLNLHLL